MSDKIVIYQIFTRLYGNNCTARIPNGSIEDNGCGKLNHFTPKVLRQIRQMGVSHVWYTGIIRHATTTDYTRYGLPRQHPAVVKGRAGSPYAIVDYYDVDPDLAEDVEQRMQEFERLVSRTHRAGLKVVIDFVPNHVARQYHSVARPEGVRDLGEDDNPEVGFDPQKNNFYYCPGQTFTPYFDLYHGEREPYTETPAKATGNDCFHNAPGRNDWYETVKLNYGVDYYAGHVGHFQPTPDTWTKMLHILLFWAQKGVDAFRCDMAEMVPAEFWAWATARVREAYPEVRFIGEVYNPAEYRRYIASGFDYLYDKVGMYDAMRDVICHRRTSEAITQAWQQTDDIRDHMLYFLENHDEQRLASDFFAGSGEKGVPGLVVSALMQKGPFMLYFGQEWGERGMDAEGFSGRDGRTTIFDYWSLSMPPTRTLPPKLGGDRGLNEGKNEDKGQDACSDPQPPNLGGLQEVYSRVLNIARTEKCVSQGQMFDVMYANRQYARQYAFLRKAGKDVMLVVANFDDQPLTMQLCIPDHAYDYLEMQERAYRAEDLLSGEERSLVLIKGTPVEVSLEARGAVVYKLR